MIMNNIRREGCSRKCCGPLQNAVVAFIW